MSITTSERARSSALPPPDVDADHIADSRRDFCRALKTARERRGVTIARIAEATKVCPSHFVALERGDLDHWPHGLFRRAFFRGYAGAIGLPVEEMLEEFVRLFPDEGSRSHALVPTAAGPEPAAWNLRLVLDGSWHEAKPPMLSRLAIAVMDLSITTLPASAIAWASGIDQATTMAIAAGSYFTVGTVFLGTSPAAWTWRRRATLARAWHRIATPAAVPAPTAEEAVEGFRLGEARAWTTDARRVRPHDVPPRIRVRFKWS